MKKRNVDALSLNKKTILKLTIVGGRNTPIDADHSGVQGCQGTATRYPCSN